MYFPTCTHYLYERDDTAEIEDNTNNKSHIIESHIIEYNICFICLEINDYDDNEYCINLHNNLYTKVCMCNGWIHKSCLNIWYTKNKNCPFCLSRMTKKIECSCTGCNSCTGYVSSKFKQIFEVVNFNNIFVRITFYFVFFVWFYYNLLLFSIFCIDKILQFTPHVIVKR
jgi:hypothetical protein